MSIYAYTGLPGSGKSYSVVEQQVLPALKSGRRLVTNVALKWDKLREAFPGCELVELPTQRVQADPSSIYEYVTPGSVLVLDEVWRLFPAGLKANHVPEPFRKLLAEHRHMVNDQGESCQIVLVTQDLAQISAFARQLVETTFRTVKLTTVGLQSQYRVDVFNGPVSGPNPPESGRIRQLFGSYRQDVYQYYETHTLKSEGATSSKVNERSLDRRANILARPVMILGGLAALGLMFYGYTRLQGFLDKPAEAQLAAAGAEQPAAAAAPISHPRMPVTRSDESPGLLGSLGDAKRSIEGTLVGVIQNLDAPEKSVALVRVGKIVQTRPLRFCSNAQGWWQCDFPDLGPLSL